MPAAAERYITVHGHFYQPPRENPWLDMVEVQDSAYPYHDWNERITAECYGPNAVARILGGHGRIAKLVNNYARISCNVGPTLMAWLEGKAPDVYQAILDADRDSIARFGGHGTALAQAYNHVIMPLASPADKITQVVWGIRDFTHRFGREPEGMWLAETAVDVATLEVLAEYGIRFTVLAPTQAKRVRPRDGAEWTDAQPGKIDPTRAYVHKLPSGRSRCSSTTAPSAAPSPSSTCCATGPASPPGCSARSSTGPARSWSTSPPTASPTATTTRTATWRWRSRWNTSRRRARRS
jgi:alpha-amylase/alpha-mannosidase (GH57 family)